MENNDSNKLETGYTREQARAWIITLALGLIICLGLVLYTLITHNLLFNYPDESLFKPGLRWLGFCGLFLYFSTSFLFWIGSSIVIFLPDKIFIAKVASIAGIVLFIISSVLLFISYLVNNLLSYLGFISMFAGSSLLISKELIEYKFAKVAKLWLYLGAILNFVGINCLAFAFNT